MICEFGLLKRILLSKKKTLNKRAVFEKALDIADIFNKAKFSAS